MAKTLGLHILADLHGVDAERIDRVEDIRNLLETAVKVADLTKISSHYYQFQPHGATGVVLLAESHISIHTWPEHGLATVDVYTCGDPTKAYRAMEYIINTLEPKRVDKQVHERGTVGEEEQSEELRSILLSA
ncbi:adenosylmethionine decarboxylase [Hydrogenivirga sp. 128-5-R1-1]|uniref:adenosylmethionine decarboxylase n=1 Tax=Hydrogenivirga sp. 128-5-R1-1 TaxID=392423 RepID=UPI00015EF8E9|nr:adenosylmethionine decarboxylase [Hydrogenivirga sp. 128-5-R1-1]EDP75254.1 S-adenosylmethionine decarboxylase proenzyme [Hydrogenivirga sp. 128-5-R1-1]